MDRETVLRLASEFTLVTKNMTEGVYVESLERFADACCAWQKEQDAVDCLNCANKGKISGLSQETYCEQCKWRGLSFGQNHFVAKVGSALNEP